MAQDASARLIVFDLDGTLTLPHLIDFGRIKARLGIPPDADILAEVAKLDGEDKERAMAVISEEETLALRKDVFQPGLEDLFTFLSKSRAKTAILTRNGAHAVEHFLEESGLRVDLAVDREFVPCKPSPRPLEHIMGKFGVGSDLTIMIGDSKDDIACGVAAGVRTVLMQNERNAHLATEASHSVTSLHELRDLLAAWLDGGEVDGMGRA